MVGIPHFWQHVIESSCFVGKSMGIPLNIGSFFGLEEAVLCDPRREAAVLSSNVPYSIVRFGKLEDVPGVVFSTSCTLIWMALTKVSSRTILRQLNAMAWIKCSLQHLGFIQTAPSSV